ncbi:transglycosylase SLT domain-containing protein [Marinicella sp. S1101]|uniref:transglycosylase SLT domain-containing protein n=1 Tax=Marinicella marina TaxID=2996016 RepID=UPI002260FD95|nr:transglycosylase SLT domain-containing protein [Marinicella marina]MCX7553349.1 transglycosylase SLT domain-containing protein [Marinicella marina]MDJ1139081.1 transglycosylase SLT domain-containing protein [Marinicella marina]
MSHKLSHSLTLVITTVMCLLWVSSPLMAGSDAERKLFRSLYAKALQGKTQEVTQKRAALNNYPIDHYLDYALIRSQIKTLPEQAIADFKKKHPDSPLNKQLKRHLLNELGRQKQWSTYLNYHNGFDQGNRQCWYLRARINQQQTQGLPALIQAMWMSGLSAPDSCNAAFKWWQQQGHLNDKLLLKRIKLAFESNNISLAQHLKTQLNNAPHWVDYAIELMRNPKTGIESSFQWPSEAELPWLIFKTSMRMAKKQPASLYQMWPNIKASHALEEEHRHQIERTMALFAATDYEPFSINAMQQLPSNMKDDQILAWIVRYYLNAGQWHSVLDALKQMSLRQLTQDRWQYWTARALAKTGKQKEAKKIFEALSLKTNYYGFLAADHLRKPYHMCKKPVTPNLANFTPPPAIVRAIELHHAGLMTAARREWNTQYKALGRDEKIALAALVKDEGWYAKVITTMADLGLWHNYDWRYPIAHEQIIKNEANSNNPMPQWVMAIIKQESAWAKDAVSHANAHGLMQLIPPTAKSIAKQLGLNLNNNRELHQPALNIKLGVQYQKNLYKQFNHPILVAAAYNAGEGKSIDWSTGFSQSPDIWIETIPYKETRGYITKILSNVTIYDWLINQQPKRISNWMPTMPIDGTVPRPWPNKLVSQQQVNATCAP